MLKRHKHAYLNARWAQPPSGGCVLKLYPLAVFRPHKRQQPPSGGCVLKPMSRTVSELVAMPAAFGRLCVETGYLLAFFVQPNPAAFRRLCVETGYLLAFFVQPNPAAFRRLCVETFCIAPTTCPLSQPPSGGCVLKLNIVFQPVFC